MPKFPTKLQQKIDERIRNNALRVLPDQSDRIDFSSNDYLGFSKASSIFNEAGAILERTVSQSNGATGSRLISGNHKLYGEAEALLCDFHNAEASVVFNSGYDANIGLFSSVPQRGDVILYDEFIHASIRDGIQMSNARAYKFKHNDLENLEMLMGKNVDGVKEVYVVTESVFSMDGDAPDLKKMLEIVERSDARLIIDEAHALGVIGEKGAGMSQYLGLESRVFARVVTFGKAMGCHGAAVLGSSELITYLLNFARSLIYTTALPPHSLATILASYGKLKSLGAGDSQLLKLLNNIAFFKSEVLHKGLKEHFIDSDSAIQCCVIPGNDKVKLIAAQLQEKGFGVKAILSPTVPAGEERLRFCLHSYNSTVEISEVLGLLATFVV